MLLVYLILQHHKASKQVFMYFESREWSGQNMHFCTKLDTQLDNIVGRMCASKGRVTAYRCHLCHSKLLRLSRVLFSSSTTRHRSCICAVYSCPAFCRVYPVLSPQILQALSYMSTLCLVTLRTCFWRSFVMRKVLSKLEKLTHISDIFRRPHLVLHRVTWRLFSYASSLICHK